MIKVNIQDAKTHFSRYIDQVEAGEILVVCRHNRPVVELRAIESSQTAPPPQRRVAGLLKGKIDWAPDAFAPMTPEELSEFENTPIFPKLEPK